MVKKLLLMVGIAASLNTAVAQQDTDYESGKQRIVRIMADDQVGTRAYNQENIQYADHKNLLKDLNTDQIAAFFNCKTLMGQAFLAEALQNPVHPKNKDSVILTRQATIRALVENPELKARVEHILETAQSQEKKVIELFSDFFIGKTCPELKQLEMLRQQKHPLAAFAEFNSKNPTMRTVSSALNALIIGSSAYMLQLIGKATYQTIKAGEPVPYGSLAVGIGYFALLGGISSYQLYKEYSSASEKRSNIHALNQLITAAQEIEILAKEYSLNTEFKVSDIKDAKGSSLIKALKYSRYQQKNTKAFMFTFVHTFLYELYKEEKHLAKIFASLGEMDAYNAIATKIIESKNSNHKLCFANFLDQEQPKIHAQTFWNVLVKNPVTSSVSEQRHIILTGPNAGGKTTTIRALLQNIILAQTFGVAAAETFEVTPFDVIYSYLNISDDLIGGLSLFASEVKRAQEILERMRSLDKSSKFFFALDELFTGTVAEDGQECAYSFIKKITENEKTQCIYATHFNKLKEIAQNDITRCVNYKVDAPSKNSDGKLVYPFTLSQGASDCRVALDLAREANLFA